MNVDGEWRREKGDGDLFWSVNGVLADVIQPDNVNATESCQLLFTSPLSSSATIDFVASGSGSHVTVSNYVAVVPEPASFCGLLMAGVSLALGRRGNRSMR